MGLVKEILDYLGAILTILLLGYNINLVISMSVYYTTEASIIVTTGIYAIAWVLLKIIKDAR